MDISPLHPSASGADHTTRARDERQPFFGENGFGFDDILDVVNPLQHIPIVSTIYRQVTGDEIAPGSRLAGGALFGGPIGFVVSLANAIVEDVSGRDVGEHMVAMVWPGARGGEGAPEQQVPARMAALDPAPATPQTTQELPVEATAASAPENSFLAALPTRADAMAAREAFIESRTPAEPVLSASGDVPTLSPAAMNALMMSVNLDVRAEEEDEPNADRRAAPASDLADDPASFAAWQAAAMQWSEQRH